MARYAVVDVGTNSIKFHVGEKRDDGPWTTVVDRAEVTRLGEGLSASGGQLSPAAMERSLAAIAGMADEAKRLGAVAIAAVGTMGMRTAANSEAFIAEVERRCGVRIEVIEGEEEGRLAYLAVESGVGVGSGSLAVFDTGGGSSQFTFGAGERVTEQFSLDVGAARFTERFHLDGIVGDADLQEATDAIAVDLTRLDGRAAPDRLVGLGGAVTNLTAVMLGLAIYDANAVQGARLTRVEVERQIELYRSQTSEQRRRVVGLQPKRAEVILAGACIVGTVLGKLRKDELTVSDRGLRHGVLIERFGSA